MAALSSSREQFVFSCKSRESDLLYFIKSSKVDSLKVERLGRKSLCSGDQQTFDSVVVHWEPGLVHLGKRPQNRQKSVNKTRCVWS